MLQSGKGYGMMFKANDRASGGVMKRNDWILITVVLAVSAIFLGIHFSRPQQKDGMAEVTIDGECIWLLAYF